MKVGNPTPQIGRPRAFNPEEALAKALLVFWRRGYAGAEVERLAVEGGRGAQFGGRLARIERYPARVAIGIDDGA